MCCVRVFLSPSLSCGSAQKRERRVTGRIFSTTSSRALYPLPVGEEGKTRSERTQGPQKTRFSTQYSQSVTGVVGPNRSTTYHRHDSYTYSASRTLRPDPTGYGYLVRRTLTSTHPTRPSNSSDVDISSLRGLVGTTCPVRTRKPEYPGTGVENGPHP